MAELQAKIGAIWTGGQAVKSAAAGFKTMKKELENLAKSGDLSEKELKQLEKGFDSLAKKGKELGKSLGGGGQGQGFFKRMAGGAGSFGRSVFGGGLARAGMGAGATLAGATSKTGVGELGAGVSTFASGVKLPFIAGTIAAGGFALSQVEKTGQIVDQFNEQVLRLSGGMGKASVKLEDVRKRAFASGEPTGATVMEMLALQETAGRMMMRRSGTGEREDIAERSERLGKAFQINPQTLAATTGFMTRFMGSAGGKSAMNRFLGQSIKAGGSLESGPEMQERLSAFSSMIEAGVSSGVIKGTDKQVSATVKLQRALADTSETFKGQAGARIIQGLSGAFSGGMSGGGISSMLGFGVRQIRKEKGLEPLSFVGMKKQMQKGMLDPINIMAMSRVLKMTGNKDYATLAVEAISKKGGAPVSTEQAEMIGNIFTKSGFEKNISTPEGMAKVTEKINNALVKAAEAGSVAASIGLTGDVNIGKNQPQAIEMKKILSKRNNELLEFGNQIVEARKSLSDFSTAMTSFSFKVLEPSITFIGDALRKARKKRDPSWEFIGIDKKDD